MNTTQKKSCFRNSTSFWWIYARIDAIEVSESDLLYGFEVVQKNLAQTKQAQVCGKYYVMFHEY